VMSPCSEEDSAAASSCSTVLCVWWASTLNIILAISNIRLFRPISRHPVTGWNRSIDIKKWLLSSPIYMAYPVNLHSCLRSSLTTLAHVHKCKNRGLGLLRTFFLFYFYFCWVF
jgi:hypothetical protein